MVLFVGISFKSHNRDGLYSSMSGSEMKSSLLFCSVLGKAMLGVLSRRWVGVHVKMHINRCC